MRTREEILAKMREPSDSLLNWSSAVLLPFLAYEDAKEFLGAPKDAEQEAARVAGWTIEPLAEVHIKEELRSYVEFGWGKIEDHRGLSADRTIQKCSAWVWLLGDNATLEKVEAAGYAQYGAPKLAAVCRAYGYPIPSEDGVQNMIAGRPCRNGCDEGCGIDEDEDS